ncbi:hypothetical protein ACFWYW_22935 [Nonomuraea sp. NPDC059023]|uniref:hypothetical protein n=1 Tax=unclassified Nonomuraea TaxID=2593643 RepID=UPI00369708CD
MNHAVRQLALFEAKLLLRSPVLWTSVAAMLSWRTFGTWRTMPVWHVETVQTATAVTLVGAGAFIATNLAALRDSRPGLAELLSTVPGGRAARSVAILVAGMVVTAVVSALACAVHLVSLLIASVPAGRFDAYEVLAGVVVAVLMAAAGVAVARWVPSLIAAPAVLVVYVWAVFQTGRNWLMPLVPIAGVSGDFSRPSGWHLVYLTALLALITVLGVVRDRRSRVTVAAVGVSLAGVVASGTATLAQPEARARVLDASQAGQVCRRLNGMEYCAYARFAGWIPIWQGVIDPIVRAIPPDRRSGLPGIVQVSAGQRSRGGAADITTGLAWGRNGGEAPLARSMAGQLAATVIGLPGGSRAFHNCDLRGQARAVVALWLLKQAGLEPGTYERTFYDVSNRPMAYRASDFGLIDYGQAELAAADRVLAARDSRERLWAHWRTLVSPETSMATAACLLRLDSLPPAENVRGTPCR